MPTSTPPSSARRSAPAAWLRKSSGEPAAIALYHWTFSTFLAKPGRWLEDLWVEPQFRRRGIAKALFARLSADTLAEGGGRLAWNVLDWNAACHRHL